MAVNAMAFSSADAADTKAASRAVAGVGAQIRKDGGSEIEADAVEVALQRFLLGDESGARKALRHAFDGEAQIDAILFEFQKGVMEAA